MDIASFLLPLYITNTMKEVEGKTRMQKLVFLAQRKIVENIKTKEVYKFEPGTYGPYSADLAETVRFMESKQLICEKSENKGDHTLFSYSITEFGKKLLEDSAAFGEKTKTVIAEVLKEYGSMPLSGLVDRVHEEYPDMVKR